MGRVRVGAEAGVETLPVFQILQSIANHVLFTKEEHMRPFNDFVKSNFDAARR